MKYAGMGSFIMVALALGVFLGLKADQFLKLSFPLLIWLLPLLILVAIFYKVFKDTSKK